MFSEYLLSDWEADDRKYSRGNGGGRGNGCLVMVAVLGSLLTGGFFRSGFYRDQHCTLKYSRIRTTSRLKLACVRGKYTVRID